MAPAVPQPLLELHSTSVIIDGSVVVDRVSLTVGRGEFVLLRGPTGSGKSTVLKLLAGLVRPTSGEVIVAGDRVDHFNEMERRWLRRSMGLMMQDGRLLDDRTVHENVMLPALAAEESYAEARRRGFLALEKCGLAEHADAFPARLSAGQRQLALLARAVVNRPVVILADEPTGNLDSKNGQEVMNLLSELNKEGTTIVMVTHSQHDAGYASRIINLFDGQVVTESVV